MNPAEIRRIVENGKKLGLIHAPGRAPARKAAAAPVLTSHEAAAINGVRCAFMVVTPAEAKAWLEESNAHNRRLRNSTVQAYARDMQNGDWLLNHQGLAFDDQGNLIDGQHRLAALAESNQSITFLVSTGWPTRQTSTRNTTMDTVDRGLNRSVADQLGLQHNLEDARYVVSYATVITKLCNGVRGKAVRMSTGITLGVVEQFAEGLKFAVHARTNSTGLRIAGLWGAVAFAHAVYPDKMEAFVRGLITGIGLAESNPILPFRNWLLTGAGSNPSGGSDQFYRAIVALNHIQWFAEGKSTTKPCTSEEGLRFFIAKQPAQVAAVRSLLGIQEAA